MWVPIRLLIWFRIERDVRDKLHGFASSALLLNFQCFNALPRERARTDCRDRFHMIHGAVFGQASIRAFEFQLSCSCGYSGWACDRRGDRFCGERGLAESAMQLLREKMAIATCMHFWFQVYVPFPIDGSYIPIDDSSVFLSRCHGILTRRLFTRDCLPQMKILSCPKNILPRAERKTCEAHVAGLASGGRKLWGSSSTIRAGLQCKLDSDMYSAFRGGKPGTKNQRAIPPVV